jgi:hypothetical protein
MGDDVERRTSSSIAPSAPRPESLSDIGAVQQPDGSWALDANAIKVAQQDGLLSFDINTGQYTAGGKPIWGINPDGSLTPPRTNAASLLDPGQARKAIEQVKTASEKANLVKIVTGKDAPGFNNNQINRVIDKTLGGDGTTFGGVTNPDTVTTGGGPGGSTGSGGDAAGNAAALSQQFLGAYNGAQPSQSPQATAALAAAVQAQGSGPVSAATMTPAQIAALVQAQGSAPVNAALMSPAQIAAYIEAQKGGPIDPGVAIAAHSKAAQADPSVRAALAKYDTTNELSARANQEGLVSGLQGAIAGTDPSVAAILLRQATDRNIANQYALAASSPGMSAGLAQRQAMIGAADLNSKAAADNAILRAKEITDARAQLAEVLGTQRTQDIGVATTTFNAEQGVNSDFAKAQNDRSNLNAQLLNTTNIANASNDTSTSQSNSKNVTDVNTTRAALANAIEITNANNRAAQAQKQAELNQDASKTNAGSINSANQFNATQLQQNNQFNAGQANTYNEKQADLNQDASKTNLGSYNSTNQFNATQQQQLNEYNTGQTNDISKTNANNQTNVNQTNTTAQLTQQQIDALARQNAAT